MKRWYCIDDRYDADGSESYASPEAWWQMIGECFPDEMARADYDARERDGEYWIRWNGDPDTLDAAGFDQSVVYRETEWHRVLRQAGR